MGGMLFPSTIMWLVFGAASAYLAKARGKNPYLWFCLGMFFGVFGLLFLFFSPKLKSTILRRPKPAKDPNTIDITPEVDPIYGKSFWYYLDSNSEQKGPMSLDALNAAFREQTISSQTYVWNENLDSWKFFGDLDLSKV